MCGGGGGRGESWPNLVDVKEIECTFSSAL